MMLLLDYLAHNYGMTQICSTKYPVPPHILGDMLDLANNKIITSCVV